MATKEKPHLLTLPREVRDNIYSHLHHEVMLRVPTKHRTQVLQVKNAPIVAILLTRSQLYHEYKDADCFKNLTGWLYWASPFGDPMPTIIADSRVLSQIRHLELAECVDVYYEQADFDHKIPFGEASARYLRVQLVPMLPRLKTLRFRTWYRIRTTTEHVCFESDGYVVVPVSVPHKICGLEMVQVAAGCDFTQSSRRLVHDLHSTTYFVYANEKASTKKVNFWTLEEVCDMSDELVEYRPKYRAAQLEEYEKMRKGVSAVLNAKVLGWTDKRMA